MSVDLYSKHFGFSERPFSLVPDPGFLFWSKAHARAFSVLEYGLATKAPITVVTGEVGTGKTTLLQALLAGIEDNSTVGLLSNSTVDNGSMLRWILAAFDITHNETADKVTLFQIFIDFILAEYAAGRTVLLIIDEAQNLSSAALEELRMLTNVNSNKDEVLQLILLGQPELRSIIMRPELRQFSQRVAVTYHINPMDKDTTHRYISHRLQHVGGSGHEITPEAIEKICDISQGIPRLINKICDLAFVYAASQKDPSVNLDIIQELIDDNVVLIPQSKPFLLSNTHKVAE